MTSTVTTYLLLATVPVVAAGLVRRFLRLDPVDVRRQGGTGLVGLDMESAFSSARWRHVRSRLATYLTGRSGDLSLPVLRWSHGGHGPGRSVYRPVHLSEIVGSVDGGRHDFDRHFDPVTDQAWARFSSVFAARRAGASLPPVLLVRAADGYYVLDGHHRLAVARALGESEVWAEVTDVDP